MSRHTLKNPCKFLVALLVLLFVSSLVSGQTGTSVAPDRGMSSYKTYSVSDVETIAMQSGNLMFNIRVGILPRGRGGAGAGVALGYNSKLWDSVSVDGVDQEGKDIESNSLLPSPQGGWRYRYKYYFRLDYTQTEDCTQNVKVQLV